MRGRARTPDPEPMNRDDAPMPRGLRIAIVVAIVVAVLVAAFAWWRKVEDRAQRHRVERTEATTEGRLDTTIDALALTRAEVGETAAFIAATTKERDDLQAIADALRAEIARAQGETSAAQVEAIVNGGRANELARCLQGVEQALNQLSVGDGGALASLNAVAGPCRAAGA